MVMRFRTLFDALNQDASRPPVQPVRQGASRPRPAPCRLAVEALEDRSVPASLWVSDVTLVEGHAGAQYAEVRVSLDAPTNKTVTVNFGTADGTALAGSDYQAASGKLTFAPGETSKTIRVPVRGDRLGESSETFFVKLHGAKNAKVADGSGVVTIVDDEPRLSVSDAVATEGNAGSTLLTFTATLSAAQGEAVTVDYATADGTAIAGEDYLAAFGTLTFAPGETTMSFTVEVLADATGELDETLFVNLSGASSYAFVADGQGRGTILDDDGGTDFDICQYVCCHPDGCGAPQDGSGIAP
jgi:large repetitive protein